MGVLADQPDEAPNDDPLPVKVIRSSRRKKSSAARIVDGRIEVRIPSWMSEAQERETVDALVHKVQSKRAVATTTVDLEARARTLSAVYGLPIPAEVRWVTNQSKRWASCSYEEGVIRISSRLAQVPDWVLDYVLLHEITHLVESGHGAEFHRLMSRYPKLERAEGFLEAMSLGHG